MERISRIRSTLFIMVGCRTCYVIHTYCYHLYVFCKSGDFSDRLIGHTCMALTHEHTCTHKKKKKNKERKKENKERSRNIVSSCLEVHIAFAIRVYGGGSQDFLICDNVLLTCFCYLFRHFCSLSLYLSLNNDVL
jgi:hypothetical protein